MTTSNPTPFRSAALLTCLLAGLLPAGDAAGHPGSGIVVDGRGRVFFVDTGGGIFRVDGPGRRTRLDGPAFHWMTMDAGGLFAKARLPSTADAEMRAVGSDPTLVLSSDVPLVVADGALYYPELGADGRLRIVRRTPGGERTVRAVVPPSADGEHLRWLGGLAAGPDGSLYYTEPSAVRRVARDGSVTTVASGVAPPGCEKPPGYAATSRADLRGLGVAADGTVYVAASGCAALLRITPRGETATVLRAGVPWSPTGVAVAGDDVYVLEYLHTASDDRREWLPRVRKAGKDGGVSTLAVVESR